MLWGMTSPTGHPEPLIPRDRSTQRPRGLQNDEIWSVQQVAEELQVPVKTLYAWRHQGTGPPAFRAGKYLRYMRSGVTSWIQAQIAADKHGAA